MAQRFVITCEHASAAVPAALKAYFTGAKGILGTHRAFDAGARRCAEDFAGILGVPVFAGEVSRLVVDLNRSSNHPRVFSEFTRALSAAQKHQLLRRYHAVYRQSVTGHIQTLTARGHGVVHLAMHSFTPRLDGKVRNADVGLLYDPGRKRERAFAKAARTALRATQSPWRVRLNYPYKGVSDGFTTHLRRLFPDSLYAGIEIEVNQQVVGDPARWRQLRRDLLASLLP